MKVKKVIRPRGRPKFEPYWPGQTLLAPKQKKLECPKERKTYKQAWTAYNKAKTQEKVLFLRLLRELLDEVFPEEEKPRRVGRPTLPSKDMMFCVCVREYSCYASRKAVSELKLAKDLHFIGKVPHFNSLCNFLKQETLYEKLKKLLTVSALPLAKVEAQFAIDSTGFHISPYERWMSHKWGSNKVKSKGWIKAHIASGAKTQIIAAAEITTRKIGDSPVFGNLFANYTKFFEAKEVSADKAYSSKYNLNLAVEKGIMPYIPFRSTASPDATRNPSAWIQMYYYFKRHEEEFMKKYHQRSKVETTFSMIKKRLGSKVKSKGFTAQRNELLCRFLVHNITILIQETFELGIDVDFYAANRKAAQ